MKLLSAFKFLSCLFIFTAMSCEETNQDPILIDSDGIILDRTFKIGQESTFHPQQIYATSDGLYTLKINTINDSRCPKGAVCFWQGEIALYGEWTASKKKSGIEIHTYFQDRNKQPEGFTIQIVEAIAPQVMYGMYPNPKDWVVTLLIKENNAKLDTITFTHSMKGWELYSWPNETDWNYSILMGTNREKTYEEVISNKITVVGKDSLKMLLDKFQSKEEIFWIGKRSGDGWENLSLPDANTLNEIKNYCIQKELELHVFQ